MTSTPTPRRHWLRWILVSVAILVVVLVAGIAVAVKLQPTAAPLALPASAAAPSGPLDGAWQVTTGSTAGFRVPQTVLGLTSEIVGRTKEVTGTVSVAGGQVNAASVRINLLALTSNGKEPAPQFGISLETQKYPDATVTLAQPVALDGGFAAGTAAGTPASGQLTLHGVRRTVSTVLQVRRDGSAIDVAGSIPVTFADWGIATPKGYGPIGSLAGHGTAEFLLVLRRG
jgi:polyisoprenoid-binding protein YceI